MKSHNCKIKRCLVSITLLALLFALTLRVQSQHVTKFKKGDRICFIGDSITYASVIGKSYNDYIVLFYITRFPQMKIGAACDCGIPGDTAARSLKRFKGDIISNKPTVATIMFGTNDVGKSNYKKGRLIPKFDKTRENSIKRFKNSMNTLSKILTDNNVRIIYIKPPIMDETAKLKSKPFIGVNKALEECTDELDRLAQKYNGEVVDFYTATKKANIALQAKDPSATIIGPDRVHPRCPGHLLMAYTFLKAQNMSPTVATMSVNAAKKRVSKEDNCKLSNLSVKDDTVSFDCLENALPYPVYDPARQALDLVPFIKDLNQEVLKIEGLKKGTYQVSIDDKPVMQCTNDELAKGINLATIKTTPQYEQALNVFIILKKRTQVSGGLRVTAWARMIIKNQIPTASSITEDEAIKKQLNEAKKSNNKFKIWIYSTYLKYAPEEKKHQKKVRDLLNDAYVASQPKSHHFKITMVK